MEINRISSENRKEVNEFIIFNCFLTDIVVMGRLH